MRGRRQGYALLVVMLVALIIATMGAALYGYGRLRGIGALRVEDDRKAFWAAEAGVSRMKSRMSVLGGDLNTLLPSEDADGHHTWTIDGYDCRFNVQTNTDASGYELYCTTENHSGRTVQLRLQCANPSVARYAWGAYNAGAWATWGYDRDGGKTGVNKNERSINWGGDTIGGPFFTYDILCTSGSGYMKFGTAEAIDFHQSGGNSLLSWREDKYDALHTDTASTEFLTDAEIAAKFPDGVEYLPADESELILAKRARNGSPLDAADYDDVEIGTVMARARSNYETLWDASQYWVEGTSFAGEPSPTNVYKCVVNGDTLTITKGRVYFEASLAKGLLEDRRAGNKYASRIRYYMDLDDDYSMDLPNMNTTSTSTALTKLTTTKTDLPVFLDIKFEEDPSEFSTTITLSSDPDKNIFVFRGDLLIEGVLDGRMTVVAGDNIYIGENELVYNYPADHCWANWYSLSAMHVSGDLLDALESDYNTTKLAVQDCMDNDAGFDDLITAYVRHQVIVLTDDAETGHVNTHGAYLIVNDVDYEFGKDFDIELDDVFGAPYVPSSGGTNKTDNWFEPYFPKGKYADIYYESNQWYMDLDGDGVFEGDKGASSGKEKWPQLAKFLGHKNGAVEGSTWANKAIDILNAYHMNYVSGKNGGALFNSNGIGDDKLKDASVERVRRRPASGSNYCNNESNYKANSIYDTPRDWGLTDCFYKDYVTVGMAPWDKYARQTTSTKSFGYVFGGMLEYRHSRYNPASSGLKRKFLYDWRLGTERTAGVATDKYLFGDWERLKGDDIVSF